MVRRVTLNDRAYFSVAESLTGSPIARASMLFDARRNPKNRNGRITIQGNFVDSKAIFKTAGRMIAAIHKSAFQVSILFFSDAVIGCDGSWF
jgi:hypothetical protein